MPLYYLYIVILSFALNIISKPKRVILFMSLHNLKRQECICAFK